VLRDNCVKLPNYVDLKEANEVTKRSNWNTEVVNIFITELSETIRHEEKSTVTCSCYLTKDFSSLVIFSLTEGMQRNKILP
jgi:hypothetical protein